MNITLASRKFSQKLDHNMHSQDCMRWALSTVTLYQTTNYIDIDAGLVPVPCTPTMNKTLNRITHNGLFALCNNVITNENEEDIVSWRSEQLKRGATICKYFCATMYSRLPTKNMNVLLWFTDPCLIIYRLISHNHLYHQRMEISPYRKKCVMSPIKKKQKTYCICQFSNIER